MSTDKRRISVVKISQRDVKEFGPPAEKQKKQVTSKQGSSSEESRLSYVKLSQFDLKDLGLLSHVPENTQKTCESGEKGTSLGEKNLSYVKLSELDLKDLGLLSDVSGNTQNTCKLDNKLGEEHSRKRRMYQSPVRKSISSIRKTSNSTIRRSTVFNKETKKTNVAKVNIFLSNTSNANKENNRNTSNKKTGAVEQVGTSGVRKELFKIPAANCSKTKSVKCKENTFIGNIFGSPLINIDNAEISLKKITCMQKSSFKAPLVLEKLAERNLSTVNEEASCVSPSTSGATIENITGDTSYANSEFEKDEKICQQEQISFDNSNKIGIICDILKKDEEDFQRYNDAREKRINEIYKILNEIKKCSKLELESEQILDKEINRLKIGSHINTSTPSKRTQVFKKGTQSEILRNAHDLRINVLRANIDRNCTPKEKKAQNMYNDLRKTFSLLETPKSIKTIDESKDNISMKLQEQCLLLLDTPKY